MALSSTASGESFNRFRDALALVESAGDPGAVQRHTKALGLYQFIPRYWEKWSRQHTGRSIHDFMPKDESREEKERAAHLQKKILFPAYYEKEMFPFIQRMKKKGLGANFSDEELGAIFHKLGSRDGSRFLSSGFDASEGTVDNEPIREYLAKVMRKAGSKPSEILSRIESRWRPGNVKKNLRQQEEDPEGYEQLISTTDRSKASVSVQTAEHARMKFRGNNEWVVSQLVALNSKLNSTFVNESARDLLKRVQKDSNPFL